MVCCNDFHHILHFAQSVEEDEAIVNILIAMQQESDPGHADNNSDEGNENDRYVTLNESDEEADTSKWGTRNNEIGDIMASQRHVEARITCQSPSSSKENVWWDVALREPQPTATPLSELGSPRVILRAPQQRSPEVVNLLLYFILVDCCRLTKKCGVVCECCQGRQI